jgi:hypothetical protein
MDRRRGGGGGRWEVGVVGGWGSVGGERDRGTFHTVFAIQLTSFHTNHAVRSCEAPSTKYTYLNETETETEGKNI